MKSYKFLIPIFLVALFLGSIYSLYDQKNTAQMKYDTTLEKAREYRKMDIQVDADAYYQQALEQKSSVELYQEIGSFYWDTNQMDKATKWGETMTAAYPKEVSGYEYLMKIYDTKQDYVACFDLADRVSKRNLRSDYIDEVTSRLAYAFFFNGEYQGAGVYSSGMCPVLIEDKWGYVTQTGSQSVRAKYVYAGPFIENLAPVTDADGNAFFIDPEGNKKLVILGVENVCQLGPIENGLFTLFDGEKWHIYNSDGEKKFGDFDEASAILNGIVAGQQNGDWRLYDRNGEDITGKAYKILAMDGKKAVCRNDRIFVSDGTKYTMITSTGEMVGKSGYEDVRIFNDATWAAVKLNGKWGFVDKDGTVQIQPQYEDARSFANGLAAVKREGLWGYIDTTGELVIAPQFEDAREFNAKGCAFVCIDGEWKLLRLYRTNH